MAAPPKPWERRGVNQRQINFNPDTTNTFIATPNMSPGLGGGGGMVHNPPPPPPRPTNTTNTYTSTPMYSRPMYGGYSSYGGGMYGGGYGGMYGNSSNYNRYGMQGSVDENRFIQVAEESSRQAFDSIESIVHAFGSVSMMLESTYHAVYSSFRAVLGVAENFSKMKSHFAQIFSALAVVRTLRWLYRKLLFLIGLRHQDPSLEALWQAAGTAAEQQSLLQITEADIKASKSSWPIVMFLAVVFGGPYLIWRLLSSLVPAKSQSRGWQRGQGEHYQAVTLYHFQAASRNELSFPSGQALYLAPKDQQPNVRGWLLASNGKNCGLVPANYIRIFKPKSSQSENTGAPPVLKGNAGVAAGVPGMPASRFPHRLPGIVPGAPQLPQAQPHEDDSDSELETSGPSQNSYTKQFTRDIQQLPSSPSQRIPNTQSATLPQPHPVQVKTDVNSESHISASSSQNSFMENFITQETPGTVQPSGSDPSSSVKMSEGTAQPCTAANSGEESHLRDKTVLE